MDNRIADIAASVQRGESYKSIGDRYGISRERVRQIATKHKLGGGRPAQRARLNAIMQALQSGADFDVVASQFGCGFSSVKSYAARRKVVNPVTVRKREKREERLSALADRIRSGESITGVARSVSDAHGPSIRTMLHDYCHKHGIVSLASSRWKDFGPRKEILSSVNISDWELISEMVSAVEGHKIGSKSLYCWASKHKLLRNKRRLEPRATIERNNALISVYRETLDLQVVCDQFAVSRTNAAKILRNAGFMVRSISPCPLDGLSDPVARQICELKGKKTADEIGLIFGLSKGAVIGRWYRQAHRVSQASAHGANSCGQEETHQRCFHCGSYVDECLCSGGYDD